MLGEGTTTFVCAGGSTANDVKIVATRVDNSGTGASTSDEA
jgi:hypothetical protein